MAPRAPVPQLIEHDGWTPSRRLGRWGAGLAAGLLFVAAWLPLFTGGPGGCV